MAPYIYTPLKTVLTSEDKYSNIYGVIRKYHEQGVYIRDETYDSVKVNFSTTFDIIFPHIKPGNIIRIHRLMKTDNQQYRCLKSGDVVLFSSFKENAVTYKARYSALKPTFTQADFDRVAELERWLAKKILEVSLEQIHMPGWIDMLCKVVDVKDIASHRVILIVADGTKPKLKFNWFSPNCEQYDGFPADHLVCITAWDRHAEKARKLEKGAFIAFFNLQISEAKLQLNQYELHLRGGTHYGKRIRNIHKKSVLGLKFQERLDKVYPRLTTIIEEVQESRSDVTPSHSTQIGNFAEPESCIFDVSDIGSSISSNSWSTNPADLIPRKSTQVPSKKVKLSIEFPVIIDFMVPEEVYGIKEYLTFKSNERCCIAAKVKRCLPASRNIIDFIKLVCPDCPYKESPSNEAIEKIRTKSEVLTSFPCPDCRENEKNNYLVATIWINLILKDEENYELAACLKNLHLKKLLGVYVRSVLSDPKEANKIFDFLDYVCPTLYSNELNSSPSVKSPFLKWIISRQGDQQNCKYHVLSAFRLDY